MAARRGWAEENAEELYEHAPCGYLSTLPDGTIIRVNQTFLRWTGYRGEDLVGRGRFSDLLAAGGRIYHETHYRPLLRMQGEVREIALDIVCADGRRLPVLASSVLKQDEAGVPVVVRTAVLQATDRREYERELLRARQRAEDSEARARVLAETLQESLIPPALPEVPGLDVAAVYRPAGLGDEVGGDFYDLFETADGDWAVVLGDVSGKGAGAASVTALARYTTRAAAVRTPRPRTVLRILNEALMRQQSGRFCTVVHGRIRLRDGGCRLTVASAGHPLPLLLPAQGDLRPVGEPGTLLGMFEQVDLHDAVVDLSPGDVVLFYTDGVPEARSGTEFFGDERVQDLLGDCRGGKADNIARCLVDHALQFQGGLARDDIALLVLRVP
jgi:sigma-B regulation protein RsbU (phosphoserine phosphatase)